MTSGDETPTAGRGPAWPGPGAAVSHRPLRGTDTRLENGLLHDWQARNRLASLPLALRQLEVAGNLANLRLAVAGGDEGYRGPVFMDSDVYKTLEAIGWELGRADGPELADFAHEAIALVEKAQLPDGYVNSYVQVTGKPRYAALASSHELYCAGHLIQAGIACRRGWGISSLLAVARRFADHLVETFLGREDGVDGHPIVETALAELFRETGHRPYLELAAQFIEQRGHARIGDSGFGRRYLQDHQPVRESVTEVGHVVRALYLEAGVVDVAAETGDAQLLDSSLARWADMVATKTYLTGGNGSRHEGESFGDRFELPPDRAYNETCAAIASFQWAWRLLLATGQARYADHMERLLYNGFAAAISVDGTRFFYVNPLQRRVDHFEMDDPGRRREWYSCACCPPNVMRLMAALHHYLATTRGDTLYVHQFTGASLSAPLGGGTLAVRMATGYPWSGTVELRVTGAPSAACGLALRAPAWSAGAVIRLNGAPVAVDPAAATSGYATIHRRWQPGDVLTYSLDITPRLTFPSRRLDAVHGMAALQRGPLVYCFEEVDQAGGTDVDDLDLTGEQLRERPAHLPGTGPTVLIDAPALRQPPTPRDDHPYVTSLPRQPAGEAATAIAIPYFQWDNRDGRSMRVWMPYRSPEGTSPPPTRRHQES